MQIYELITVDHDRTAEDAEGRTWYVVDPDEVYPWVIGRIAEALEGGPVPPTIRDLYLERARALPAEAWALAATDRDLLDEADPAELTQRREALTLTRAWALELHHGAIGYGPRGVHIVKRPAWRE